MPEMVFRLLSFRVFGLGLEVGNLIVSLLIFMFGLVPIVRVVWYSDS